MQLSVVVPVRNEAENILPLLEEIHAALEGNGCATAARGGNPLTAHRTRRHLRGDVPTEATRCRLDDMLSGDIAPLR